jgi:hypothetical protein
MPSSKGADRTEWLTSETNGLNKNNQLNELMVSAQTNQLST